MNWVSLIIGALLRPPLEKFSKNKIIPSLFEGNIRVDIPYIEKNWSLKTKEGINGIRYPKLPPTEENKKKNHKFRKLEVIVINNTDSTISISETSF